MVQALCPSLHSLSMGAGHAGHPELPFPKDEAHVSFHLLWHPHLWV